MKEFRVRIRMINPIFIKTPQLVRVTEFGEHYKIWFSEGVHTSTTVDFGSILVDWEYNTEESGRLFESGGLFNLTRFGKEYYLIKVEYSLQEIANMLDEVKCNKRITSDITYDLYINHMIRSAGRKINKCKRLVKGLLDNEMEDFNVTSIINIEAMGGTSEDKLIIINKCLKNAISLYRAEMKGYINKCNEWSTLHLGRSQVIDI